MRGTATRVAGELLVLLVALLGAVAAPPPPPPPPPPFILHHLAHHLKGKDEHHVSAPSVVYAQPAAPLYAQSVYAQPVAPVYAQAPYHPSRLPEKLVIQVEPTHHRNLPVALAQAGNQDQGELRRPIRVRTQAVQGSALPPHQTFVQVKVADPRSPGSALGASGPAAASASVTTHQHVAGANPTFRPAHVPGASGEVSHAQAQAQVQAQAQAQAQVQALAQAQAQALVSQRSGGSARKLLFPPGTPGNPGAPDQHIRNTIFT